MLSTLAPGKYIREIFMTDSIGGFDSEYEAIVITGQRLAFCTHDTFETLKEVKGFLATVSGDGLMTSEDWRQISLDDNPDYLCQIIYNIS